MKKYARLCFAILNTNTHRYIRAHVSKLNLSNRKIILDELDILQNQGLLDPSKADVIKLRYNFDMAPLPAKPTSAPVKPAVIAPEPESVVPPHLLNPPLNPSREPRAHTITNPAQRNQYQDRVISRRVLCDRMPRPFSARL